jgi:hypothetical protein
MDPVRLFMECVGRAPGKFLAWYMPIAIVLVGLVEGATR